MIIFSYREVTEPRGQEGEVRGNPTFDQSIGQNFVIGPFATVVSQQSSGGLEDNCAQTQPIVIGVLHDIKERLEHQKAYTGVEDAFEVNQPTLQLFCNKNAEITLADSSGNELILQKVPFIRGVPAEGTPEDIGTEVRINATLVPKGAPVPTQPTTYGDELLPDRVLDTATSSQTGI